MARTTVRMVVCSEATEHRYDRSVAQSYAKLDGFSNVFEGLLNANNDRRKRDCGTLKSIWKKLCNQDCRVSNCAVRRYARRWMRWQGNGLSETFVLLPFDPLMRASATHGCKKK